ncbi:hypothetical protein [Kitasatospora cineracea]|uniref:hypothetical protein n=1 Tax=Kitasatospora cineracea TaxID=88074 RepID=UPI0037F66B62
MDTHQLLSRPTRRLVAVGLGLMAALTVPTGAAVALAPYPADPSATATPSSHHSPLYGGDEWNNSSSGREHGPLR